MIVSIIKFSKFHLHTYFCHIILEVKWKKQYSNSCMKTMEDENEGRWMIVWMKWRYDYLQCICISMYYHDCWWDIK